MHYCNSHAQESPARTQCGYPNCLRLDTLDKVELGPLLCPDYMFQDHNLVAKFHRITPIYARASGEHAGNIDRYGERLSHRVHCDSLCKFLPRCNFRSRGTCPRPPPLGGGGLKGILQGFITFLFVCLFVFCFCLFDCLIV